MKLAALIILSILTTVFFNEIEIFVRNINFTWTASKITPYLLMVFYGCFFGLIFFKSKILMSKTLKVILSFILFVAPFSVCFAFYPIYEGDFSKEGKKAQSEIKMEEFNNIDFVVLTIPGCPFCHESISKVNLMQERTPKLKIKYIVCTSNLAAKAEYRKALNPKIKVELGRNLTQLLSLSEGKFPCFVKINHSKAIYKWHNNQFGTRAKDWIESNEF